MEIELKKCTVKNYKEFFRIANAAFNRSGPNWFEDNGGHIFLQKEDPMFEAYVNNNFIAYFDDEPAGTIGIYPINAVTESGCFKVAGIGTVGVLEEHRGKGIMSFMMEKALAEVEKQGYELSWLVGERQRYKNFGYDLGGKTLRVNLDLKSFRKFTENGSISTKTPETDDYMDMDEMHKGYQNRVVRGRELWTRHLARKNLVWKYMDKKAYFVFDRKTPELILEAAGNFEVLVSMVKQHVENHSIEDVEIRFPYEKNELILKMCDISSGYTFSSCNQFRVINPQSPPWDRISSQTVRFCADLFSNDVSKTLPIYINEIDKV